MQVSAVNGSPRKGGNTEKMLNTVLTVCQQAGLTTELYQAGGAGSARLPGKLTR
ncbi:MAG: NAD(P)H-dependent oxidoreductase [Candidatus Margulisbacteria bacterium]|jgi:multimeric flavodoxin WrbA|nr:NAD(P)H-dependent oxidoreductase [Candidatus Margulisiibacteriota bacterium]